MGKSSKDNGLEILLGSKNCWNQDTKAMSWNNRDCWSEKDVPKTGRAEALSRPLQNEDHSGLRGFCWYFEMVLGFLLCQKPCWGGNWRCIVETSLGAQEMTSLHELMVNVRKFFFIISKFCEESSRPESGVCFGLCIQIHLIVFFPH